MKPIITFILVLLIVPLMALGFDHSSFDAILKANVRDERVDYLNIKAKHQAELEAYLDAMSKFDPASLPRPEQLAFYINLYNATMIKAVIDRYHPGYSPADKDFAVFKDPLARFNGKAVSLNDLENKIIRPEFKDPRIHVALVCGARSCPPLLPRAYSGADLDKTLDENMRNFMADKFRNMVDVRKKELKLSKIFEWYAEDFGGAKGVAAYVDQYHLADLSKFKVSHMEYSWELNIVK